MRYIGVVVAASVSLIAAESAVAYHDNTHRRLSLNAYQHSRLSAPQALLRLGLHPTDRFEGITGGGPEQIPDLVLRGAVSEDYRFHGFAVVTHFFDPAHGGLALNPCPVVCVPSPDWALEDQTSFRLQDSSFRKARLDLFRALRYKDPTAFGRMFEILGRVIHHVEDMAQPQHTRNDLHIPPGYPFGSAIRAAYELTTEHTYGYGTEDVDANVIQQNLDGLEIARARELWMTTDEGVGPAAGRGISQYSNGNFVTQGTNFQGVDRIYAASGGILLIDAGTDPNYVLPSGSAATLTAVTYGQEINDVPEDVEIPISQPPPDAVINWVGTDDLDALLGQTSRNLFTSKLALNAGDLAGLAVSAELPGGFTLGNGNFVEARRRLLPKAVAYSAALLNYFFRGTILSDRTPALRFSLGSFGFGNNVLGGGPASMTLRNASNEDLHGGKLQVFYDTAGGTRALLGEKGIDIRAGKTVTIGSADTGFFRDGATWETLWGPQRAAQGSIVLVYVGSMGAEASPPGDDGSEYAVASRVCTCPPQFDGSGPSGPDDPQRYVGATHPKQRFEGIHRKEVVQR